MEEKRAVILEHLKLLPHVKRHHFLGGDGLGLWLLELLCQHLRLCRSPAMTRQVDASFYLTLLRTDKHAEIRNKARKLGPQSVENSVVIVLY